MEFLIAFAVSLLVGMGAGAFVRVRFSKSSFVYICNHLTVLVTILLFAFFLFYWFGLNIWTIVLIPLLTTILSFVIVRKAIARLLETR